MSVTYADFIDAFPEFSEEGIDRVQARLDQAALEVPSGAWGDLADRGVMLRAADALSTGPSGSTARVKGQQKTTYRLELERYERIAACGLGRVA